MNYALANAGGVKPVQSMKFAMQFILVAAITMLSQTAGAACEECTLESCPLSTEDDIKCWADRNFFAGRTCYQALKKASRQLTYSEKQLIIDIFKKKDPDAQCEEPNILVQGALLSSLVVSKGGKGLGGSEHALQLMPSFSLGIPIPIGNENDASKALNGSVTFGGLVIRYTPASYWIAFNVLLGTAEPGSTSKLDPEIYVSPKLLSYGFGVSGLGNIVNVNLLWSDLRKEGFFSKRTATAQYVNIGIDLSAVGFFAVGATK
jgi:hypothetical protein